MTVSNIRSLHIHIPSRLASTSSPLLSISSPRPSYLLPPHGSLLMLRNFCEYIRTSSRVELLSVLLPVAPLGPSKDSILEFIPRRPPTLSSPTALSTRHSFQPSFRLLSFACSWFLLVRRRFAPLWSCHTSCDVVSLAVEICIISVF